MEGIEWRVTGREEALRCPIGFATFVLEVGSVKAVFSAFACKVAWGPAATLHVASHIREFKIHPLSQSAGI